MTDSRCQAREIAVLDWKCRNFRRSIRMKRALKLCHLLEQHTDRPAIHNDVMHGQNQYVLGGTTCARVWHE